MTMGIGELKKSGAFVATVFALVVALVPFALEQIGDTTGLFEFKVTKTISGWFSGPGSRHVSTAAVKPVDWERYRQDLEAFTGWVDGQSKAVISPPVAPVVIRVRETEKKPERMMWSVPVVSCTASDPMGRKKGYVFMSGFSRPYYEGEVILPSKEMCGYEIVSIGERTVWLRAIFESENDSPMGVVKFPEFTRVESDSLVKGNRRYVARDAFPLASGGWLMIDSFMPPDGAVFKILDENRGVIASILCIVIGEKGGR